MALWTYLVVPASAGPMIVKLLKVYSLNALARADRYKEIRFRTMNLLPIWW